MSYCPNCKYEYTDGIETCPDCNVELVAEIPNEEEWVPVYFSSDENEVLIVKGVLEDAGIPVWGETDVVNELEPLGETNEPVMVPASRLEDAKTAIQTALKMAEEIPEDAESSSEE